MGTPAERLVVLGRRSLPPCLCARQRAVLFDTETADGGRPIADSVVRYGWRRHFLSRVWPQQLARAPTPNDLGSMVCPAAQWNGGLRGTPGCSLLAMTNRSVERIRAAWREEAAREAGSGQYGVQSRPVDDDVIG